MQDVKNQVSEILVRDLFETLGHDREFADAQAFDIGPCDHLFLRARGEELDAGIGAFDQTTADAAAILGFDHDVFVAFADDLVGIDDIRQKGIEARSANAGEIGTNVRAFTVEFVADEAGFLDQLMAGLDIRRTSSEDHFFLFFNDLLFVRIRRTDAPNHLGGASAEKLVPRFGQRANGGHRQLDRGNGFGFERRQERNRPPTA
jgi:hypothetical protein